MVCFTHIIGSTGQQEIQQRHCQTDLCIRKMNFPHNDQPYDDKSMRQDRHDPRSQRRMIQRKADTLHGDGSLDHRVRKRHHRRGQQTGSGAGFQMCLLLKETYILHAQQTVCLSDCLDGFRRGNFRKHAHDKKGKD